MTMIESVAVRQRGGFDFETHYDNLCALQSSCPLTAIKAHLPEGIIDLNGDRIRAVDWIPILNTIRINKTLQLMAFRSYFQQTLEDQERAGYPIKKKTPAIRCKEITYRLCRALKECLQVTPTLRCLEIQGLPLRDRDLSGLAKGLMKNNTLQHLSLEYSRIGDDGLEVLCRGIKNSISITSINFNACNLTWKGADHIAKIIKHQATKRHNEAWQDSLRYRRPDLDRMPGIRRISINCNPMLGDQGATLLAEALKDDLWLKALDLQQCGVSEVGAKALLDVLKYNTTIVVLDLRQNPMIEQEMLHSIMEQVMINCNGQDTEYKWVKASPLQDPMKPKVRKKRTKTLQNSFGKKTSIKVPGRRRSRSAGANSSTENIKPGPGMPWRTAQRANRYRGYPPEGAGSPGKVYENVTDLSASPEHSPGGAAVRLDYSSEEDTTDTLHVYRGSKQHMSEDDLTSDRELKVELEHLRRRFREEKSSRATVEGKLIELSMENKRLSRELEEYKTRHSILDDDRVLESIEASFKQFHAFLDLVRDAGLGQLITLAGIDQSQMAIPLSSPQRLSLGGRLSSSFIKPRKLDLTFDNPPSPEHGFHPINGTTYRPLAPHLGPDESHVRVNNTRNMVNTTVNTTANTTANTTGMSSDGDVSLPVPVRLLPDNYRANSDPTLPTTGLISLHGMRPKSKFDELYQKVLRETEGALTKTAGDSMNSTLGQSTLDYTGMNGGGDRRDRPDTSDHSSGSHHSTSKDASKDTVIPRDVAPENHWDLDPSDMVMERHSDKSDISEIEEVIDNTPSKLCSVPENTPNKQSDSDEEDF